MEIRITFRSEIYIKGETLADCAEQWEQMELFSANSYIFKHPNSSIGSRLSQRIRAGA